MHPLKDIEFEVLFTSLKIFTPLFDYYRVKKIEKAEAKACTGKTEKHIDEETKANSSKKSDLIKKSSMKRKKTMLTNS